jgi:hypothetical protein
LGEVEALRRIKENFPKTDRYSWVEETGICPACEYESFDKIGSVDFDWNPDGIIESGGYGHHCRVCELDVSEYEFSLISNLPIQ